MEHTVHVRTLHRWNVTPHDAASIQTRLRRQISLSRLRRSIQVIAGADLAIDEKRNQGIAGIIAYRLLGSPPTLHEIERVSVSGRLRFPYIPGLLSFREAPLLLRAWKRLHITPDLLICDGQGIAHPRGFGLASHLGLLLDRPTIGCAKSCLVGTYSNPGRSRGSHTPLRHNGRIVGAVVRSRTDVRPLFVSPGHRITVQEAVRIILACCDGYRLPKPTREADHFVVRLKKNHAHTNKSEHVDFMDVLGGARSAPDPLNWQQRNL